MLVGTSILPHLRPWNESLEFSVDQDDEERVTNHECLPFSPRRENS